MNIIFFGSFQHYSALILQSLIDAPNINVVGVITTPPMPVGRKQIITPTPVHSLAEKHNIPVFTPSILNVESLNDFKRAAGPHEVGASTTKSSSGDISLPDFFITAGYGKILPQSWLNYPKINSLNLHFSLLPAYRGANPAEWAIMCGESTTGITLMKMDSKLDGGDILAQAEINIESSDTRETIYQKLYSLGAQMLPQWLTDSSLLASPKPQAKSETPYAALLKRDDGFLPWPTIQKFLHHQKLEIPDFPSPHLQTAFESSEKTHFLERLPLALSGYPSLWTIVSTTKGDKRMKILDFVPFTVQLEGKQPSLFNQIKNTISFDS